MLLRPDDAHVVKDSRRKFRRRRCHLFSASLRRLARHSLSYKQIEAVDESAQLKARGPWSRHRSLDFSRCC